jgi:glycosyltransferase involved in cell wall biosynthesis
MTLVVFFTRGMSLEGWHRAGILERELALYRGLNVERLAFVTYGGPDDGRYAADMPGLDVLSNAWRLPSNLYSVLAPLVHRRYLRAASVFRTNQINGAWSALVASMLFRRPLVVRCGFLWADNVARATANPMRRAISRWLERRAFRAADRIVVASEPHARSVSTRYGVDAGRITVIPNYVDTARFRPLPGTAREDGRIMFVGRLEAEKNVSTLLEAVQPIPGARLTIAGDGSLRARLEYEARERGVDAEFLGRVEHAALPELLSRSRVFVLPSRYEGSPKALLEAMACGVPVVGARVPGIEDVIVDRGNGLLAGTTVDEIRAALVELLGDAALRQKLSEAGVRYVAERCSLAVAVERERAVLGAVAPAM